MFPAAHLKSGEDSTGRQAPHSRAGLRPVGGGTRLHWRSKIVSIFKGANTQNAQKQTRRLPRRGRRRGKTVMEGVKKAANLPRLLPQTALRPAAPLSEGALGGVCFGFAHYDGSMKGLCADKTAQSIDKQPAAQPAQKFQGCAHIMSGRSFPVPTQLTEHLAPPVLAHGTNLGTAAPNFPQSGQAAAHTAPGRGGSAASPLDASPR